MTENKKPGKCAIYSRVSTKGQELEKQVDLLKNLASQQNCKVYKIYRDKMSGGASDRPQFQQMFKDARLRKFDIIYVWSLDRFSREGIVNTLTYLKRLKKYGVALKSMSEQWADTTDEGLGEILISIVAWLSKQERQRISKHTKRTLDRYKKDLEEKGFYINKKGEKKMVTIDDMYSLDWKQILHRAIQSRPTSWRIENPVAEYRNAGDCIAGQVIQEMKDKGLIKEK